MIEGRALTGHCGIADQHVEPLVTLVERRGEPVEAVVIAHVERHQRRRTAGLAHRVVEFFKPADRARYGDHMRAGACQRQRRRIADAARGAGDERDTVGKDGGMLSWLRRAARAGAARLLRHAVGERGRVFAGEAMIGELRPHRIAALLAHGAIDALDREEGERIGADELAHAFEIVGRGQELVPLGRVDAVIVRVRDRRRSDAEMHFAGAGLAHHLHDLHRGRAAHDRVVDQHDALAGRPPRGWRCA